mgnify:FL=1
MKLNTVIIEDEIPAARLLHSMVSSLRPEWNIEIIPGSVDDAVEWFASHEHPELIFLDIHLTDGDAFDFLSAAKPKSAVIFTTAYDQYAIRAFSVNSIDYILKPVDEQRLSDAIAKYETLHGQAWLKSEKYMETLLETLKHPEKKYRSRFLISGTDEFWLLRVEDIAYFYSEEKTTFAVTPSGREHILDLSLNKLEEQLDPEQFFRVNRQMILNVDAIDRAAPFFKGRIKVVVHPPFKSDIIISEGKASAFRSWLNY